MVREKPHSSDPSAEMVIHEPFRDPATVSAAQHALPFVTRAGDGSTACWPCLPTDDDSNAASERIQGERWALELMRFYRDFGHEPRARLLPLVLRDGVAGKPLNPERFTGFLHVLDAMLAFAARQTDLDLYAADLDATHQRTLAAWATLSGRDN